MPPGSETNAPRGDGGDAQRAERAQDAAALPFGLEQARKQRAHRQPVDVAGVDARQQRLGQIVHGLLAESPPHERRDRLVSRWPRGTKTSPAIRSLPPQVKSDDRASAPSLIGNPRNDPSTSGCSRPSRRTYAVRGSSVETSRSPRPSSRQSADGRRLLDEQRVRTAVDHPAVEPLGRDDAARARGAASSTRTRSPRRCSSYAAASPAMPPPTTATSTRRSRFDPVRRVMPIRLARVRFVRSAGSD